MPCPLCNGNTAFFFEDERRAYQQCKKCALIFVPAEFHLMRAEEKAQYDLHENNPKDSDYRQFLSRLSDPLIRKLSPNSSGLDFGCGSGPTLSVILEEAGHQVALYDPFYKPDPTTLKATWSSTRRSSCARWSMATAFSTRAATWNRCGIACAKAAGWE